MSHLEGFVMKWKEQKLCRLINSLYEFKQAPHTWYKNLANQLLKLNLKHFNIDDTILFVNKVESSIV